MGATIIEIKPHRWGWKVFESPWQGRAKAFFCVTPLAATPESPAPRKILVASSD
jgi:hypothetical protein